MKVNKIYKKKIQIKSGDYLYFSCSSWRLSILGTHAHKKVSVNWERGKKPRRKKAIKENVKRRL